MVWGWIGNLLLWFIIFIVFFWLIFYSLKPNWAQKNGVVDTAKILFASVVMSALIVLIIWIIMAMMFQDRRRATARTAHQQ
jgi:hypothetical protein